MSKSATVSSAIFGIIAVATGVLFAFSNMNSDPDIVLCEFVLGLPVILLAGGISCYFNGKAIRLKLLTRKIATVRHCAILIAGYAAYRLAAGCLVPSNIEFQYSYPGNTGTFQEVQFYFKQDGHWLNGPMVEAWPMTVSFPDINHDGYPDIRVTENPNRGCVEFLYLPKNDGRSFWQLARNDSRLVAVYAPVK